MYTYLLPQFSSYRLGNYTFLFVLHHFEPLSRLGRMWQTCRRALGSALLSCFDTTSAIWLFGQVFTHYNSSVPRHWHSCRTYWAHIRLPVYVFTSWIPVSVFGIDSGFVFVCMTVFSLDSQFFSTIICDTCLVTIEVNSRNLNILMSRTC